jgi:hypothetical protein
VELLSVGKTALSKIQNGVDKARGKLALKGFREFKVFLVNPVRIGEDPVLGRTGTIKLDFIYEIKPSPKINDSSTSYSKTGYSLIDSGQLRLTQISRSYDEKTLSDSSLLWKIEGAAHEGFYRLISLYPQNTQWTAVLEYVTKQFEG